jgi:hypothetical protein
MQLSKEIMPARIAPLSKMSELKKTSVKDESVYGSTEFYPSSWYSYDLGAGRDFDDKQVIFAKVMCYPVRYSPATSTVDYATGFDITVTYDAPVTTTNALNTCDMVVIAPAAFEAKLQPLIDDKINHGVNTTFKSMEDIYAQYDGADPPEQVKYFIKEAYDTLGIKYVLLVGGLNSHINADDKDATSYGSTDWHVPVRYVSIPQGDDEGCICDIYYGCLYNETGAFDSWDSNGDGYYAAWGAGMGIPNDVFDMYPEVYVSRLAVTNKIEVNLMVKKIIKYESTGPDAKAWYKKFVGVGGKTFDYYGGKPDGEYLCDLAFNYTKNAVPDLTLVPVYTTNRDSGGPVPDPKGIAKTFSKGAGFVDFEGHGFPLGWNTIWFDGEYDNHDWAGGISIYYFWQLFNGNKQPVVVVGGCHNAMFNISVIPGIKDKAGTSYFCYGYPGPFCFSWGLMLKYPGGAIGSTGCTGYGMGYEGNPNTLSGELEMNFFSQIGNGTENLASAHSGAIRKFLNEEPIDQIEAFCITNWEVFGDPSLKFGGYAS